MIILAATIILAINNNNVVDKAKDAVSETNYKQVQELAQVAWAEGYVSGKRTQEELENYVKESLVNSGVSESEQAKYNIEVTTTGVTVTIKGAGEEKWYDGWTAAYIDSGSWSTKMLPEDFEGITEATVEEMEGIFDEGGIIMARFYKTGSKVTPEKLDDTIFPEGDAYKMVISGYGAMSNLFDTSEPNGWTGDLIKYLSDSSTELPLIVYTTEIIIEEGITSMGTYTVYGTMSCNSIKIPSTLIDLGEASIFGNSGDIIVDSSNPNFTSDNGVLYSKDKTTIINCPITKTSITLPSNLTEIKSATFAGCNNLASITLPEGLKVIGDMAFDSCSKLTSITIPSTVEIIEDEAFAGCSGLKTVKILSNNLTSIEFFAFGGCTALETITIPKSVTTIGSYAFQDSELLATVNYTGTEEEWGNITISDGNDALVNATKVYNYVEE